MDAGSASAPRCVFIAGYGRSGSTLVDAVLGAAPGAVGTGELRWLFYQRQQGLPCSCGAAFGDCGYWAPLLADLEARLAPEDLAAAEAVSERVERWRGGAGWRQPADPAARDDAARYARVWSAVFAAIGARARVVVDSTKTNHRTSYRAQALAALVGIAVQPVHLVRDLRAVLYSSRRVLTERQGNQLGAARARDSVARTTASWWISNRAAERAMRDLPGGVRIRYEDLVGAPTPTFARLGAALGLDVGSVVERLAAGEGIPTGHGVSGNRWRRAGVLTLRADEEWKANASTAIRLAPYALLPMVRRYGY